MHEFSHQNYSKYFRISKIGCLLFPRHKSHTTSHPGFKIETNFDGGTQVVDVSIRSSRLTSMNIESFTMNGEFRCFWSVCCAVSGRGKSGFHDFYRVLLNKINFGFLLVLPFLSRLHCAARLHYCGRSVWKTTSEVLCRFCTSLRENKLSVSLLVLINFRSFHASSNKKIYK